MSSVSELLLDVLERARAAGALGPGPVLTHVGHAEGFGVAAEAALGRSPASFADLGSGGGVPGLVLSLRWTGARGSCIDSNHRRCAALREALAVLGVEDRVEVIEARAELVARRTSLREHFEAVTARSFAGPAVTAEIAAGLVAVGGVAVVSEPPDSRGQRWPPDGLRELGFAPAEPVEWSGAHFAVLSKESAVPERFPRGVGRPGKRPLW